MTADQARQVLAQSKVLTQLAGYQAQAASTLFVGFDTDGSDIDIICTYQVAEDFLHDLTRLLGHHTAFVVKVRATHVVARFSFAGVLFEVYGSRLAPAAQPALRHYRVMARLAALGGTAMQQAVRAQRQRGLKTEPAIAAVLGLDGDPYQAVLALEDQDDAYLKALLLARL